MEEWKNRQSHWGTIPKAFGDVSSQHPHIFKDDGYKRQISSSMTIYTKTHLRHKVSGCLHRHPREGGEPLLVVDSRLRGNDEKQCIKKQCIKNGFK